MPRETKSKDQMVPLVNAEKKKVALTADFGTLYIMVRGDQIMRPVKAQMTLYEKLGHIYKQQDKCLITAAGYKHLNKVASISIVTPQRVVVEGVAKSNPCVERNPDTKAIETVNIRKLGIGYSPAGNIVVIDKTLFYNVYTYFIQSLQAKMKRVKWVSGKPTDEKIHPNCAVYGIKEKEPDKKGSWVFFPTEPPLGIWVNYEDQATIDCLEEHTQRQRFGDRIATTIIERNILKDHPAIAVGQVYQKENREVGTFASVIVYGYRHELEPKNINQILKQTETGFEEEGMEIKAETITSTGLEEEKAAIEEVAGETHGEKVEGTLFDEQKAGK